MKTGDKTMTMNITRNYERKEKIINKILNSPTFLPDCTMMERLSKVLFKMSLEDLGTLDLLISAKQVEAARNPGEYIEVNS